MHENILLGILILLSILLVILFIALIINKEFRNDIMASPGEASFLGIISVKGVVIVLLTAMLVGAVANLGNGVLEQSRTSFENLSKNLKDMKNKNKNRIK